MATHSSVLAWRIPGTGSLVGCCLCGCTELDTIKATQQQQQHVCVCVCVYTVVVQSLSSESLQLFGPLQTPWTAACQLPLSFIISQSLLRFMFIGLVILSNHLNLCWPLLLLPSVFSSIRVFSNKLTLCIKWLKYWSFSFSPSSE